MCFLKKRFKQLEDKMEGLQKLIETNELARLQKVEKEHISTVGDLQNIKFRVKSVKYSEQERTVVINYEVPPIVLNIDDSGKPELNKTFKSINLLNMVGMDDFKKIQEVLDKIKPIDNE